jgi:hypothetical protein
MVLVDNHDFFGPLMIWRVLQNDNQQSDFSSARIMLLNPRLRKITYNLALVLDVIHPLDLCSSSLVGFPDLEDFSHFLS